jgi:antitoxin (DNA-binding transcriptional repressor) of toxin-antitoxin stability system
MTVVTIHEAKTNLSKLLAAAEAGEEIVIARGKAQIAKIVALKPPPAEKPRPRVPGKYKGMIALGSAFFDPLPADELSAWGLE